jgi:hypothetical protein
MKGASRCLLFVLTAAAAVAQTTGRIEGTVTDSQGAAVPKAAVSVANTQTGHTLATTSNEVGYWVMPALPTAFYRVSISLQGFKTATVERVKVDAGLPATVNVTLEVGTLAETVEVVGGAEVLQTTTATVNSTLVGRQLHELPFTSRNLTELIVTQAGTATPSIPRSSSINGLPKGAFNVTLDGINIQDNINKSGDGFFNAIFPRADAIEEMVVTTAAAGADNNGEGAAQIKFVTRSGTNDFHGGVFWYHRNTYFNANYFFNNIDRLPRDRVLLNQVGGMLGGPIRRNKLFFFIHYEAFRLPQSYPSPNQTVIAPQARNGDFRYRDTATGAVRTVNLLSLAGGRGFPSTVDPLVANTLDTIAGLVSGTGNLRDRIDTNNDYNRLNYNFQTPGKNDRDFPTVKLNWNATANHQVEVVYNYQKNLRLPDGLNTAIPIFPGTGIVLNSPVIGNQKGIAFSFVAAVRSVITPRLTSEVRYGFTGGNVIFNDGVAPSDFAQWRGYAPTLNFVTSPFRSTGQSRRNTPIRQGNVGLTWSRTSHLVSFGASFTQVNSWSAGFNNSQFTQGISFAMATGDPANTGATSLFTTTSFPNSTPANLTEAAAMYAMLTGRVSSITRNVILGEQSRTYGANATVDRNRQREFAFYVQDSWRVRSDLTLNGGLRWDHQNPYENLNGVYTRPGYEGVWGVSGVGNLFAPGVLRGAVPVYYPVERGAKAYNSPMNFSPSFGLAWTLPKASNRLVSRLSGGGAVLRAGYSISTIREDLGRIGAVWGANQGRTVNASVDPNNFPAAFGPAGSVLFRNPTLPVRNIPETPSYPIPVLAGNAVREFDPNLKVGYVQSWTLGFQREISRDTVLEIRYVGNHGTGLWRQIDLNETNIFENGFLEEFRIAQANLAVARQANPASNQFSGLAGQRPLPIIRAAIGADTDQTTAIQLAQGQAGALANGIATNATRMGRLTAAGRPANFFRVNPTTGSGASSLYVNGAHTTYNALQVEVRRRMHAGLLLQGSYTFAKALANEYTDGIGGSFTTLRNGALDKGPSSLDIRHAVKLNWIYELPFGPRKRYGSSFGNPLARRAIEGWEIASVTRVQSGSPDRLNSGRATFNQADGGVVLVNMTTHDLQKMLQIRKTTSPTGQGVIYYLPQSVIDNTLAAFEVGGKTLRDLDPTRPFIAPPSVAGQLGQKIYIYGPWQQKWDFSLLKKTSLGETRNIEFRAQFLNAFNLTNFFLEPGGNSTVNNTTIGSGFGQTRSAYRDLTNTNDPGARVIEFVLRFNF